MWMVSFKNHLLKALICAFCFSPVLCVAKLTVSDKQAFIKRVATAVELANCHIYQDRITLKTYYQQISNHRTSGNQKIPAGLLALAASYDVDMQQKNAWEIIFLRIDIVPPSMAIAQAIIESAWGTSRFAVQGDNYFGVHCYQQGCGIVPKRHAGKTIFEVKRYASLAASAEDYMHNINTHAAYKALREQRRLARLDGSLLIGYDLLAGLTHYSALGEAYATQLAAIMKTNQLTGYDYREPPMQACGG